MQNTFEMHASEETLERYSMGALDDVELALFEEHLLVCPLCQDRLAEVEAFVRATREAARNLPPQAPTEKRKLLSRFTLPRPVLVPVMAALVVLGGAVGWWTTHRRQGGAPVVVSLEAFRGGAALPGAQAPSDRPLLLQLDLTGLPESAAYEVEIVSALGRPVRESTVRGPAVSQVPLPGLARGAYWVRLYGSPPRRELLREFGLHVR